MEYTGNKYLEGGVMNGLCRENTYLSTYSDPLCKLNLKETSEFVMSLPLPNNSSESRGYLEIPAQNVGNSDIIRSFEAPATPGRPIFSFSNGGYPRKSFPSKWDDAEKWLVGGNDSPAHNSHYHGLLFKTIEPSRTFSRQCSLGGGQVFAEKPRVAVDKTFDGDYTSSRAVNGVSLSTSADLFLKDKFPNPKSGFMEPMQEGSLFKSKIEKTVDAGTIEAVNEVKHRDIGTEMTPLGSSTTSRCPTPFMSTSPARNNTPTGRSGPLTPGSFDTSSTIDLTVTQLQESLHRGSSQFGLVTLDWSTREEEEEDVSKSLRHFEMSGECRKSVTGLKSSTWEEEHKSKRCLRYEREEAKIQAWVNLQSAKAESESRKLEVKIQKMRMNMEEKLMKRMADVHRKAEEWRAAAQFEHSEQIRKVNQKARKAVTRNQNSHKSCSCFPCYKHHDHV